MTTQNLNARNPFGNPTKPGLQTKRPLKNPFGNINIRQDDNEDFQVLNLNPNKENQNALQSPFESKLLNQEKVFFGQPVTRPDKTQPSASPLETTEGVVRRNSGLAVREDRKDQGNFSSSQFDGGRSFQSGAGSSMQQPFFTNPSAMAAPSTSFSSYGAGQQVSQSAPAYDEENEPPLLEDLGIDLEVIKMRTLAVLKFQPLDERFARDADMSGPLLIAITFGSLLLLQGKIHFGYIYGFGIIGTFSIYLIMNLLSQFARARFYNTMSILGYCLLPLVVLSFFGVFLNLQTWYGFILCTGTIIWATIAATRFFTVLLDLLPKKVLVGYPIFLFYLVFVLLTIF